MRSATPLLRIFDSTTLLAQTGSRRPVPEPRTGQVPLRFVLLAEYVISPGQYAPIRETSREEACRLTRVRDFLTLVLGVVTGLLSGAFGVGGAIISTPGIRLLGAPALVAVGTTLPSIIPGAAFGEACYHRERLVDWRTVAATAPAGIVAAVVGALASHRLPGGGTWLMVLTAALLGLTALRMARAALATSHTEVLDLSARARRGPAMAAGVGAAAGGLSGLLGVGGGLVLVPGLSEVLGLPLKRAIATSLACVGIFAVPGTVTHAFLGDIDWRLALLLTVGVLPGARLGATISIAMSARRLRLAVAIGLGVVAVVYGAGELAAAL